jgi:copper chaperone CopZ
MAVTQSLSSLVGVGQVHVSLAEGVATVHFNEKLTSPARIRVAVEEAGYGVDHAGPAHTHRAVAVTASASETS